MFEKLSDRFQDVLRNLTGRGTLTEANVEEAMREVRRALLEADVNYTIVKEFVEQVRGEFLGEKVLKSITPGQQAIKIVYDQLTSLLGEANVPLDLSQGPTGIMLIGLHGSGKTTTAAKLASLLQTKFDRKVMLAACDLRRPAAIDQLEFLGRDLKIPVVARRDTTDVVAVATEAWRQAQVQGVGVIIFDTAGRLQVDDDLVQELVQVKNAVNPREILLVADAALGQEAVSVAEHFNRALDITGIILTKLDGDARGGAALSMRKVTGKPIKFVGVGERIPDLESFHPERMASRILGMGDIVSLVEKATAQYEENEAQQLEEKMRKNSFDLTDFLDQLRKIKKMGGILSLMDMFPGSRQFRDNLNVDEKQLRRVEGIICGMTPKERKNPDIINANRRRRIAKGSGVEIAAVHELLKRFDMMRQMLSGFNKYEKMIKETGRVPNPRALPNQQNPIMNRIRHGSGRRFR